MKLSELQAYFVRHAVETADEHLGRNLPDGTVQWGGFPTDVFHRVDALAEAHGIVFLCPKSYAKNGGVAGTHGVRVYFEGSPVPSHIGTNNKGETVRWSVQGTGLGDLTLRPSILEQDEGSVDPCGWHGYVTNGQASDA